MTEKGVDLALDGNAAADLLQEIFVLDITIAHIQPTFRTLIAHHSGSRRR
jgi:hypothetical protein